MSPGPADVHFVWEKNGRELETCVPTQTHTLPDGRTHVLSWLRDAIGESAEYRCSVLSSAGNKTSRVQVTVLRHGKWRGPAPCRAPAGKRSARYTASLPGASASSTPPPHSCHVSLWVSVWRGWEVRVLRARAPCSVSTLRGAGRVHSSGAGVCPTSASSTCPAGGLPGPPPAWCTLTPPCLQAWLCPGHGEACPSSPGDFPQHVSTLLRFTSCALSGTMLPDTRPLGTVRSREGPREPCFCFQTARGNVHSTAYPSSQASLRGCASVSSLLAYDSGFSVCSVPTSASAFNFQVFVVPLLVLVHPREFASMLRDAEKAPVLLV